MLKLRKIGALSAVTARMLAGLASPALAGSGQSTDGPGQVLGVNSPDAIADSYIVVLAESPALATQGVRSVAQRLATSNHGSLEAVYEASLHGFATRMSATDAARVAADPAVKYVQQDQTVSLAGVQPNPPSWGLDRVDQRALPLNSSYTYPNTAANVHAYIIDTGVRLTHQTFGGRAVSGRDTVDDDDNATDCNGHGTHVAGTVGGGQYGVAKGVQIVAVRVMSCAGTGSTTNIVEGIDWVTAHAVKPAVANMSLGGSKNQALDDAVSSSIASGITYAIAAGNGNLFGQPKDACGTSPARVATAITVGATDINDNRASFSNYGTCVDVFAPGVNITSSWDAGDTATKTISGTSMAAPDVAGGAALYLSLNPTATPAQVQSALTSAATKGVVEDPRAGSPNRLLFVPNPR